MNDFKMNGFYLFPNVFDQEFEQKLINIIETDYRFVRYMNNGKLFYQMEPKDFPDEWRILLELVAKLHNSCVGFDYSLQLKYEPGIYFRAHYDSKHRWEEFIVGVNLKSEAELYFTKKGCETIIKKIPPASIYILSGDSRYKWRHGIKKVKDIRYSITLRKKTQLEKNTQ
jgi:alkylated DNA repair dioxygenase AlkB